MDIAYDILAGIGLSVIATILFCIMVNLWSD